MLPTKNFLPEAMALHSEVADKDHHRPSQGNAKESVAVEDTRMIPTGKRQSLPEAVQ